jgi:hypothetical protein
LRPTTSDRLWASQPSARSPRTALQAGGAFELQVDVESCWAVAAEPANSVNPNAKSNVLAKKNILESPFIVRPSNFSLA